MKIARATAHTNIALIKYWGKSAVEGNVPATGSLSLTLDRFYTTTTVRSADDASDRFALNNAPAESGAQARVFAFADEIRALAGRNDRLSIVSNNFVPTASGLASSASGFAALTLALTRYFDLDLDARALSRLARRGSGSAARSFFGGLVLMHGGPGLSDQEAFAEPVVTPLLPTLRMVVLECAKGAKAISSREAMQRCRDTSVFYKSFLDAHPGLLEAARVSAQQGDLEQLGALMEQSTLQMHATLLGCSPPFWYFNATTIAALDAVRALRKSGTLCFFTMDAGPHVKVLCTSDDADQIAKHVEGLEGVLRVTICAPGPGAICS